MDVLDGPSGSELPQKSQQIDLLPVLTRMPMGKAMAHMAVVFAELERDFIRMRTREAIVTEMEIDTRTPRFQGHRRRRYLRLPRPYQPQPTQLQM